MTPHEYNLALEGYNSREKKEWRKIALLLNTMGKSLKKPITVDELLGIKKETNMITREEKEDTLKNLKEQFGG